MHSPRLRFNHWLPRLLQVDAITLYPYIFCAWPEAEMHPTTLPHEMAHFAQVERYGWLRFYASYLLYYFAERVKGEDHFSAYWNIPYEIEAREAEVRPPDELGRQG